MVAAGLTACSVVGFAYHEPEGSDLATVRVVSQGGDASSKKADPNARILQVDGMRVPQFLPHNLTIAGGIRYVGVEASAGSVSARQCVQLMAKSGQRYVIRVAGPERDWAVSIRNEEMGDEVVPLKVIRTKVSCPESQ
jgi:hypothetical protein